MGAQQKIYPGYAAGEAIAVAPTDARHHGYVVWSCTCSCGSSFEADSREISRGAVRDCGCGRGLNSGPKTLVGKRFGRLTVTSYAGKVKDRRAWNCVCDCGREVCVAQHLLRAGKTKSCGCLRTEQTAKNAGRIDGSSTVMVNRFRETPSPLNTSGCSGVYFNRRIGKWTAQITFKRKTKYLGSFDDKQDAIEARKQAEVIFDEYLAQVQAKGAKRTAACETSPEFKRGGE